jgi:hypothetical protein
MVSIATRYTDSLRHRDPVAGNQWQQVVLIAHRGEHVAQIRERILAMALTGYDDRVNNGRALAGAGVADEQPVLFADGRMAFSMRLLSSRVCPWSRWAVRTDQGSGF